MKRANPHKELGSFKKGSKVYKRYIPPTQTRIEAPDKDEHIALKFFIFYEYAHPKYKSPNPYKKEFLKWLDTLKADRDDEPKIIYQLFQRYKKNYNKPVKPEWIANRPTETTIDTFKEMR